MSVLPVSPTGEALTRKHGFSWSLRSIFYHARRNHGVVPTNGSGVNHAQWIKWTRKYRAKHARKNKTGCPIAGSSSARMETSHATKPRTSIPITAIVASLRRILPRVLGFTSRMTSFWQIPWGAPLGDAWRKRLQLRFSRLRGFAKYSPELRTYNLPRCHLSGPPPT